MEGNNENITNVIKQEPPDYESDNEGTVEVIEEADSRLLQLYESLLEHLTDLVTTYYAMVWAEIPRGPISRQNPIPQSVKQEPDKAATGEMPFTTVDQNIEAHVAENSDHASNIVQGQASCSFENTGQSPKHNPLRVVALTSNAEFNNLNHSENGGQSPLLTKEGLYRCSRCQYTTRRTVGLARHVKGCAEKNKSNCGHNADAKHIPLIQKPFACNFCMYRGAKVAHLKLHLRAKHQLTYNYKEAKD